MQQPEEQNAKNKKAGKGNEIREGKENSSILNDPKTGKPLPEKKAFQPDKTSKNPEEFIANEANRRADED